MYWRTNKTSLIPAYKNINPYIIELNSYVMQHNENVKIPSYKTHTINTNNEINDSISIKVKYCVQRRILDYFIFDALVIQITNTTRQNQYSTHISSTQTPLFTTPKPLFPELSTMSRPHFGDAQCHTPDSRQRKNKRSSNISR